MDFHLLLDFARFQKLHAAGAKGVALQFLGDWLIRNCRNRAILLVDISFNLNLELR